MAFVDDARWWVTTRQQWGQPVGKHQAIARMVSSYAAHLFAMKSMVYLTCALADRKNVDIRLEAAAAKYFCSETLYRILDDYLQVRGGRGYERATSLYERGERPTSVEMAIRDMRVGRIFEGSSQVMHLIMAREALDTHFKLVMPILQPKPGQKLSKGEAMMKAAGFYSTWLPKLFMPETGHHFEARHLSEVNRKHLAYAGALVGTEPNGRVVMSPFFGHEETRFRASERDMARLRKGVRTIARIFLAAGAKRVLLPFEEPTYVTSEADLPVVDAKMRKLSDFQCGTSHPQGGNPMSDDPEIGAVKSNLAVHGVNGLFVCDASVFPDSVEVNPMLSVMAIAMANAQEMLAS